MVAAANVVGNSLCDSWRKTTLVQINSLTPILRGTGNLLLHDGEYDPLSSIIHEVALSFLLWSQDCRLQDKERFTFTFLAARQRCRATVLSGLYTLSIYSKRMYHLITKPFAVSYLTLWLICWNFCSLLGLHSRTKKISWRFL